MHPTQMRSTDSALLVVDVQQKLMDKIPSAPALERNIAFLIDGARVLDVQTMATEQYPKGLGPIVQSLSDRLPQRWDKLAFSCCAVQQLGDRLHQSGKSAVLLAGIETHVCILHTALDLLDHRFRVYIAVDAVSSRYALDHEIALRRLEHAGAVLTTSEGAIFEWLGSAQHPRFKDISLLVQKRMANSSS
jgi:nicotinamidase-related amidase